MASVVVHDKRDLDVPREMMLMEVSPSGEHLAASSVERARNAEEMAALMANQRANANTTYTQQQYTTHQPGGGEITTTTTTMETQGQPQYSEAVYTTQQALGSPYAPQYYATQGSIAGGHQLVGGALIAGAGTTSSSNTAHHYAARGSQSQYYQSGAIAGGQYMAGSMVTGAQVLPGYVSGQQHVYRDTSGITETSRVIGHEFGEQRVVSITERVDEARASIISERYVEHEIKVPKKIVREEVIEKVIVVPERQVFEEVIEDRQIVREKIVEIAKPTIIEKIVEVPEIEIVEKVIEIPEKIVQEKLVHKDRIEYQEVIVEVPRIVEQERIIEVADVQYRNVPVEKIVEVDDWREEVIIKEVKVPQYVDQPVPEYVQIEQIIDFERKIPVPVEAVVSYEYRLPRIKPRYTKVSYQVYLPRFIEIPVAVELLQAGLVSQAESYLQQITALTRSAASLCEIEGLAQTIMKADMQAQVARIDVQSAVLEAWKAGILNFGGGYSSTTTTTTAGRVMGGGYTTTGGSYTTGGAAYTTGGSYTTGGAGYTTGGYVSGGMYGQSSTIGATALPAITSGATTTTLATTSGPAMITPGGAIMTSTAIPLPAGEIVTKKTKRSSKHKHGAAW